MDQSAEASVSKIAEETSRVGRHIAEISELAAHANAEMITGQAKSAERIWQSGTELASQMTTRSADQFARALWIGGDKAEEAAQELSRNIGAIVQSGSVLTHGARAVSTEWFEIMRKRIEQSLDHMETFMRCRSPQDLVAAQIDALRLHVEGLTEAVHRISKVMLKAADEASRSRLS